MTKNILERLKRIVRNVDVYGHPIGLTFKG